MRIIIDIDGEDVTVRTESAEKRQAAYPSNTPPPELLRAAATLGATSAGRGPTEAELIEQATRLSDVMIEALPAEAGDAGAGPFAPPGMYVPDNGEQASGIDDQQS